MTKREAQSLEDLFLSGGCGGWLPTAVEVNGFVFAATATNDDKYARLRVYRRSSLDGLDPDDVDFFTKLVEAEVAIEGLMVKEPDQD